jgi:ornithine decarboxylase
MALSSGEAPPAASVLSPFPAADPISSYKNLGKKYHLMVGPGVGPPTDSYYVQDLSTLRNVYKEWTEALPNVKPYYAVKCNPDTELVACLATLGSNFDCASPSEIQQVLDLGVDPGRILYANPCKRSQDMVFAKNVKILRTTFDSVCELKKMARVGWNPELLLRIRADDPKARCNLGVKYGAEENDWDILLFTARAYGFTVIGVSFHVGSFATSPGIFSAGVRKAEQAIELARDHGYSPRIIDIGGGFSASHGLPKDQIHTEYELIAEPGRFFVERVSTLYTPVIGTKGSGVTIDESLYGAFNCILFDHAAPLPKEVLRGGIPLRTDSVAMTIFGSTCDGGDLIAKEALLPADTSEGDVIVWENMGAYTSAATTQFNGFPFNNRKKIYIE